MRRRRFLLYSLVSCTLLFGNDKKAWKLGKYGEFSFENLHKNIFIMHGTISAPDSDNMGFVTNPAFIETKNGLIVIDPGGSYAIGEHVLVQIRRVTEKPVIAIFNTHDHGDHWFANAVFKEAFPDLKVYAHTLMRQSALELYAGKYYDRGFTFDYTNKIVFADVTVDDGEHVEIDGERFLIQHPSSAHTNNDISISHLNSNTIFMGDLLMESTLANFGLHSSIRGNIRFLEKINSEKEYDFYVPGHGRSGDKESVFTPYYMYLSIIEDEVKKAYSKEVSRAGLDETKEKIILRLGWEEKLSFSHSFVDRYMHHIYSELEEDEIS